MSVLFTMSVNAQDCSELFFSEYVEGYGQNKAIEIYNPTTVAIDLSDYKVERYSNGATTNSGGITSLTGILASGDAFVLTSGETDSTSTFGFIDPVLFAMGDMAEPVGSYPTPLHMNGDDAMVLTKNGAIIDVIGKVGEEPASGAWTADSTSGFTMGSWWTANHTMIRKSTVKVGDGNGLDLFNPSLEWDSLPAPNWGDLGMHTCDCVGSTGLSEVRDVSYIVYPNPANIGETITVNTTSKIESIELVNILGEKVLTETSNQIATTNLSKGTYIIIINLTDGRKVDNKIIIE